ncbi:MAG: hypothetical protein WBO55_10255 [Rhizobiaceae bacterium]
MTVGTMRFDLVVIVSVPHSITCVVLRRPVHEVGQLAVGSDRVLVPHLSTMCWSDERERHERVDCSLLNAIAVCESHL